MFPTVKPIPRRVDVACYNETYQKKLEMFTKRVSLSLVLISMHCLSLYRALTGMILVTGCARTILNYNLLRGLSSVLVAKMNKDSEILVDIYN